MAFPAGVSTVTVEGDFFGPDGSPSEGSVSFALTVPRLNYDTAKAIITSAPKVVRVGSDGKISVALAVNDDADADPQGSAYLVTELLRGREPSQYIMVLSSADAPTINLAAVKKVQSPPAVEYYSAEAHLSEHIGAIDPHNDRAYADGLVSGIASELTEHEGTTTGAHGLPNPTTLVVTSDSRLSDARPPTSHSHAISDTTGLQTALDGKQAADSDLETIAGLAPSDDSVLQRKSGAWTGRTPAQLKTDLALAKADVGLGSVDNTSDANKPVSTAVQTALDDKAQERIFTVVWPNGVADQKVDIYFTAPNGFHGYLDISHTGMYGNGNAFGRIRATYSLVLIGGNTVNNQAVTTQETSAQTAAHFTMAPCAYDAANSRYKITIAHLTSTGTITRTYVQFRSTSVTQQTILSATGVTAVYTTDATVYPTLVPWQQPLDADLTAYAGLATTGLVNRTGAGTVATIDPATKMDVVAPTSFVPTWLSASDPQPTNGSISMRYVTLGNIVMAWGKFLAVADTTFGTGRWRFSLPVAAHSTYHTLGYSNIGEVWAQDYGTVYKMGYAYLVDSGNFGILQPDTYTVWDPSVPFTWAAGNDKFFFKLQYIKA